LPSYDQGVALGFHSCSAAMMTAIVETYGYKLVGVGGTKDTLFVHESSLGGGGVVEANMADSFFAFADCCLAESNPSMVAYLETTPAEFGFTPPKELPPPSRWMQLADSRSTGEAPRTAEASRLGDSIAHYMHAACRSAASKWSKAHPMSDPNGCAFDYVMGRDPKAAAVKFLAKVLGSSEVVTKT
jgi:hypothetical protein